MIDNRKINYKTFRMVNVEDRLQHNAEQLYAHYKEQLGCAWQEYHRYGENKRELKELAHGDVHRLQGILHGFRMMMALSGLKI